MNKGDRQFRSLFDYNLDAALILDLHMQFSEINPMTLELTGYSRQEMVGARGFDFVAPHHRALAKQRFQEAVEGKSVKLEIEILHKDGRAIDVFITSGPLMVDGNVIGVFAIAKDITQSKQQEAEILRLNKDLERRVAERAAGLSAANLELTAQIANRRQIERELRQSEGKYRGIVENTHDVIMLTRSDGKILYLSPATRAVLGYEPEDLEGNRPSIIHPDDRDRVRRLQELALQGASGTNEEYRIVTKTGQIKWVSHSWSYIPDNPYSTVLSVVHEITQQKISQQRDENHRNELRALASELVMAEERERRRIASDLHDDLGQKLALAHIRLYMMVAGAAGTALEAPLAQVRQLIDDAMKASRTLTFRIVPPALYDLGLLPAAEWLAEDMLQQYGLHVQLFADKHDLSMDERARVLLYRCMRELLFSTR